MEDNFKTGRTTIIYFTFILHFLIGYAPKLIKYHVINNFPLLYPLDIKIITSLNKKFQSQSQSTLEHILIYGFSGPWIFEKKILKTIPSYFYYFLNICFFSVCVVPSLIKMGLVVLEKKSKGYRQQKDDAQILIRKSHFMHKFSCIPVSSFKKFWPFI